jgi:cytochrome b6-f complex iron-sulfur subunit
MPALRRLRRGLSFGRALVETMDPSESNLRDPGGRLDAARRRFLVGLGWGGLSLLFATGIPGLIRFFRPQPGAVDARAVTLGPLLDYRSSTVSTRWVRRYGLWLVHRDGRLFALEARCTHLGCTPRWSAEEALFRCPCHGSGFSPDGVPLNGPATLPLMRLAIRVERDQVVVDRATAARMEDAEEDPDFFVRV